ncbi:MAG: hypothetical protein AAGA48_32170 [Myxococcota bacterium]
MISAFQAEWVRLSDPRVRVWIPLATAVFSAVVGVAVVQLLATQGSVLGFGGIRYTAEMFSRTEGPAMLTARVVMLTGLLTASLGAFQFASGFEHGTLRTTLQRAPSRASLYVGRLLATLGFAAGLAWVAAACVLASTWLGAAYAGIDTTPWLLASGVASAFRGALCLTGAAVGFATVGALFGVILRSSLVAITVAGTVALFEGLLASLLPTSWQVLPGQVFAALARGGTEVVSFASSAVFTFLYVLVMASIAGWVFCRRDVVA